MIRPVHDEAVLYEFRNIIAMSLKRKYYVLYTFAKFLVRRIVALFKTEKERQTKAVNWYHHH